MTAAVDASLQSAIDSLSVPGIAIGHRLISPGDEDALLPEEAPGLRVERREGAAGERCRAHRRPRASEPARLSELCAAQGCLGSTDLAGRRRRFAGSRFPCRARGGRARPATFGGGRNRRRAGRTAAARSAGPGRDRRGSGPIWPPIRIAGGCCSSPRKRSTRRSFRSTARSSITTTSRSISPRESAHAAQRSRRGAAVLPVARAWLRWRSSRAEIAAAVGERCLAVHAVTATTVCPTAGTG